MVIYTQAQLWLLAALVLVVFEMSAPGLFYFFSFACGALMAAQIAHLGYALTVQLSTLLIGSLVALFILKRWVNNFNRSRAKHETNVYALIGKHGVVVRAGDNGRTAQVRVGGELWSAQAVDKSDLPVKALVTIKNVTGVKLVVEVENKLNGKDMS